MMARPRHARRTAYRAREAGVWPTQFAAASVLRRSFIDLGNAAEPQSVVVEVDPAVNVSVVDPSIVTTARSRQSPVNPKATLLATRIRDPRRR
jgi:hypothetical protein